MTREEKLTKMDRMRYTKDKFPANLILVAIVLDALYFVSLYQSDVGTYFYTWQTGASVVYNLIFMLSAFLASEGVKSRQTSYTPLLAVLGIMQFVRIFYIPAKAHAAVIMIAEQEIAVMSDGQFYYMVGCLAVSGICILAAAAVSLINSKNLASYMRSIQN